MDYKTPFLVLEMGFFFWISDEPCNLRWLLLSASDMQLELWQIWGRFRAYL